MILDFIHLHAIFFLWATTLTHSETKPFIINKCCPEGKVLALANKTFVCTVSDFAQYDDSTNKSVEDFNWFPIDSIVNSTTLKIHEHHAEEYLKMLKEKYIINVGVRPECGKDYTPELAIFLKGTREFFHYIVNDENLFRIYVSKPKSLHDPIKDRIQFERINQTKEMDNEVLTEISNETAFRTFPLEDACVDMSAYQVHLLLYCPCRLTSCVRKCCGHNQFFNASSVSCEDISKLDVDLPNNNWRPDMEGITSKYYLLTDTYPTCNGSPIFLKHPYQAYDKCKSYNKESDNNFTIFSNGSAKISKYKTPFSSEEYCGEVTWHENGMVYEQNLLLCNRAKDKENNKQIKFIIYGILLILGGVCLLITVAVSLLLPELRRRIHNKIALSHNASLMVAYFAWGITQLAPKLDSNSCIFLSLLIQFTFLGSFFWNNVMCIDISMTFSATRSLGGNSNSGTSKKFIFYCVYSWGTTSIISIITILMEFLNDVPYDIPRPGISCGCGFNQNTYAILIYFYGPMAVLLLFNLVLFIFTTFKIMTIQRQTAILHKTESNTSGGISHQSDKQRYDLIQWLILYAKLFLLMGLTWVTEIVSWAFGGPDYYWYFSDTINLLRAVFIFILFICKKPVLLSLKRKLTGESISFFNKTGSSKSTTDVISITTSGRDSRFRSSTSSSSKRRDTCGKIEMESQKTRKVSEVLARNFNSFDESRI